MKILRTAAIALIGISLSTPSAHACELDLSFFTWIYQIMHPQPDSHDNRGGDNRGGNGRDCNHSGSGGGSTIIPCASQRASQSPLRKVASQARRAIMLEMPASGCCTDRAMPTGESSIDITV